MSIMGDPYQHLQRHTPPLMGVSVTTAGPKTPEGKARALANLAKGEGQRILP